MHPGHRSACASATHIILRPLRTKPRDFVDNCSHTQWETRSMHVLGDPPPTTVISIEEPPHFSTRLILLTFRDESHNVRVREGSVLRNFCDSLHSPANCPQTEKQAALDPVDIGTAGGLANMLRRFDHTPSFAGCHLGMEPDAHEGLMSVDQTRSCSASVGTLSASRQD